MRSVMDEKLATGTAPPKKKWVDFFKGKTGQRLIIAAGVLGIALILLSEFWPKDVYKRQVKPSERKRRRIFVCYTLRKTGGTVFIDCAAGFVYILENSPDHMLPTFIFNRRKNRGSL